MPATRIQSKLQTQSRHYAIRIGLVWLIMLDTIRRSFLQHDAFDRAMFVIELLVLALIAVEGIIHIVHWVKFRWRIRRARPFHLSGLLLQDEYRERYRSNPDASAADEWMKRVDTWTEATSAKIKRCSSDAAIAFRRDSGGVIRLYGNQNSPQASYMWLETRLNNLTEIIENAHNYF
jgi:hypothetical protein